MTKQGKEVRKLRAAKGLSQTALAARCAVTYQYISRVEHGDDVFKLGSEFARKLSDALGVQLSHWVEFTPDGPGLVDSLAGLPLRGVVRAGGGDGPDKPLPSFRLGGFADGAFAAVVDGTCLTGLGLHDGDVVACLPAADPVPGKLMVLETGRGWHIKGYADDGQYYTQPTADGPVVWKGPKSAKVIGVFDRIVKGPRDFPLGLGNK